MCDAASWLPVEGAMENAWDAGVLPVVITHNDNDYPSSDACKVRSPADMPKALAIGAVEPSFTLDYHDWPYAGYSNRGGGTSRVWLLNAYYPVQGAMSMVDLVASGLPGYVTDSAGIWGTISVDGYYVVDGWGAHIPDPGTSFAAPQVAGAALQVKQRHLETRRHLDRKSRASARGHAHHGRPRYARHDRRDAIILRTERSHPLWS
jgi:subtilisin family serine protease